MEHGGVLQPKMPLKLCMVEVILLDELRAKLHFTSTHTAKTVINRKSMQIYEIHGHVTLVD